MNHSIQRSFLRATAVLGGGALTVSAIMLVAMTRGPQFTRVDAFPLVRIGIGDLRPGEARFFAYRDQASDQIRFLLARDSAWRIRAAPMLEDKL